MRSTGLVFLVVVILSACGWERARKKQVLEMDYEVRVSPALVDRIAIRESYLEFSESWNVYVLILEVKYLGWLDCEPLSVLGVTEHGAGTVFSRSESISGSKEDWDLMNAMLRGEGAVSARDRVGSKVLVESASFAINFPNDVVRDAGNEGFVAFRVGSVIAKHTKKWFLWSDNPLCSSR